MSERLSEKLGRGAAGKFSYQARFTLWMIFFWTLWLTLVTTWPVPYQLSITGTAFVILFGGYWWSTFEGAAYILLMSFIFTAVSLTPSGFFWLSSFIVFLVVKVASMRLGIRSPLELAIGIFLVALGLHLTQLCFLSQIVKVPYVLSFTIVWRILLSSVIQAGLSFFVAGPYQGLLSAK